MQINLKYFKTENPIRRQGFQTKQRELTVPTDSKVIIYPASGVKFPELRLRFDPVYFEGIRKRLFPVC